jgi:hypothetical protein
MTEMQPIAKLATALALAQAEFKPIIKDKTVTSGSYKYRYADLASVREAVTPALAKNGLAIVQTFRPNGGVHQYVDTLLVHSSGESISSSYQIPATGKQQEIGSAITYARRYSLCAILGVVAEDDDDGNAADQKQVKVEQTVSTQAAGKLDAIAKQPEDTYELVDDDGEVTKFKLGLDWLPQCELLLQTSQDASAAWDRNSKAFYAIKEKVTKNKHKTGMDRCQQLLALANKLTQPAEMRP